MSFRACLMLRTKKRVQHICGKMFGHSGQHACGQTHLVDHKPEVCKETW